MKIRKRLSVLVLMLALFTAIFGEAAGSGKSAVCTVTCQAAQEEQSKACPVCGSPVKDGQKFCGMCGADLSGAHGQESEQTSGKEPEAGSIISFGHYPQTSSGTDSTPIEWIVLDYDPENNRALLISRYGLDRQPYNTSFFSFTDTTWEECTLRTWLNDEFLNKAFTAQEQGAILTTNVDNSMDQGYSEWNTNGGNNTQDKVFLLSYAEANRYFGVTYGDSSNMKSRAATTEYAVRLYDIDSGFETADRKVARWWWLRSPGSIQSNAAAVGDDGSLFSGNNHFDNGCVRPALWISLESEIF